MKRIILFISISLLLCGSLFAQEKGSTMPLYVYVADMVEPFPTSAKAQLENKLNRLLTQNGISSTNHATQFLLTAVATPLTKDILPGPPTQIAETMEITFYVADVYNKMIFSSTSVNTRGVGTTDAKSYIDALKKINLNTPALKAFVQEGKEKIINYYDSQAELMFAKARSLATQHKYDEALFIVGSIPTECKHYLAAIAVGNEIFKQYNDYVCQVNLAQARQAWVAGQNVLTAAQAGEYLGQIYPDAACYDEAMALYNEIRSKVLDDWKFEMKKYQDSVDLEASRIDAWRAIGVAYGENQPNQTTSIEFLRGRY